MANPEASSLETPGEPGRSVRAGASPTPIEELWREHRGELLSFLRLRVGDAELAEDLLQGVFVKAQAGLPELRVERPRAWLYRVARNAVIDHYRTRRVGEPLPDDLPETPAGDVEPGVGLERCVRPMIELLPAGYREAVLLAHIEGLPLATVAERLGLSLSGAKSRVRRGRAMLERCFLDCCQVEVDRRGKPIRWAAKGDCCTAAPCCAPEPV
jgi:RNA polymerase sigma-70 factor (ECF subfamily)